MLREEKVNQVVSDVDEKMKYFTDIGNPIIDFYAHDLDELMLKISGFLTNSRVDDLNTNELQYYFMQLTGVLYLTTTNVEKVGLLMDLSNMSYKDAFNTSLLNNSSSDAKMTVARLNAQADKDSLESNAVSFIYSRTYKILKAKIDSANEMIRTLSKIISFKMNSMAVEDKFDVSTKRLLMEG